MDPNAVLGAVSRLMLWQPFIAQDPWRKMALALGRSILGTALSTEYVVHEMAKIGKKMSACTGILYDLSESTAYRYLDVGSKIWILVNTRRRKVEVINTENH